MLIVFRLMLAPALISIAEAYRAFQMMRTTWMFARYDFVKQREEEPREGGGVGLIHLAQALGGS
jgi:hypothetical protein